MNSKKKIAFIIGELKYSGAAKILTWVANKLDSDGYEITIITYLGKDKVYELQEGIKHIALDTNKTNRILRSFEVIKQLCEKIRQDKYNLLISFLPVESMYAVIASKLCRVPVVVCERSDPYFEKSFIADLARYLFRYADGAIFQTKGAQDFFPTKLRMKSIIIPNPVLQVVDVIPYEARENVITTASRLYIKQKRQDVLLNAFSYIMKQEPSVKLIIVGDGPDEEKLKQLADELHITQNVVFAGRQNNVLDIVANSKVFVLTSDYEGIPNALIEALSAGVPSVSTDCSPGGARMVVQHGESGFIVPREDANQIADKILWLLNNVSDAERFSKNALNINENYSEERIYVLWKRYLESLMEEKQSCEN